MLGAARQRRWGWRTRQARGIAPWLMQRVPSSEAGTLCGRSTHACAVACAWGMCGACVRYVYACDGCQRWVRAAPPTSPSLFLWPIIVGLSGANESIGLRDPEGDDVGDDAFELEPL